MPALVRQFRVKPAAHAGSPGETSAPLDDARIREHSEIPQLVNLRSAGCHHARPPPTPRKKPIADDSEAHLFSMLLVYSDEATGQYGNGSHIPNAMMANFVSPAARPQLG